MSGCYLVSSSAGSPSTITVARAVEATRTAWVKCNSNARKWKAKSAAAKADSVGPVVEWCPEAVEAKVGR